MKLSIQYLNDREGKIKAVQLPLDEWKKLMNKLNEYENTFKIKSDLEEAFSEVKKLQQGKLKKETLPDFLNGI